LYSVVVFKGGNIDNRGNALIALVRLSLIPSNHAANHDLEICTIAGVVNLGMMSCPEVEISSIVKISQFVIITLDSFRWVVV